MKQYLLDTFAFNNVANRKMIEKIKTLPDQAEAIRYLSHLINSQNKWMARIRQVPEAPEMSWWEPLYTVGRLVTEWEQSLTTWQSYIQAMSEEELHREVTFTGYDGNQWAATPLDIALQLNYHSIHHRAQIQVLIRQQGIEPDFIDYIGTRYRKVGR